MYLTLDGQVQTRLKHRASRWWVWLRKSADRWMHDSREKALACRRNADVHRPISCVSCHVFMRFVTLCCKSLYQNASFAYDSLDVVRLYARRSFKCMLLHVTQSDISRTSYCAWYAQPHDETLFTFLVKPKQIYFGAMRQHDARSGDYTYNCDAQSCIAGKVKWQW